MEVYSQRVSFAHVYPTLLAPKVSNALPEISQAWKGACGRVECKGDDDDEELLITWEASCSAEQFF